MTTRRKVLELCNYVMWPNGAGLIYSPTVSIFFSKYIYSSSTNAKYITQVMSPSKLSLCFRLLQGVKALLLKDALATLSVFFKYSLSPAAKQSSEYPLCLQQRELTVTWSQCRALKEEFQLFALQSNLSPEAYYSSYTQLKNRMYLGLAHWGNLK